MPELPEVVQALLDPKAYPDSPQRIEPVQTQMSFLFLADDYVYKIKKPVDLDDLKKFYPNLDITHLTVDTQHDSPQDWYIIGVGKR